jgi:5'-methylthioadenosine phosphorylase
MRAHNIAIIGGTGFDELPPEVFAEPVHIDTPYGPACLLSVSNNYVEPHNLYFLARHGAEHGIAPHQINYRANIAALVALDVGSVFATNAVGSLRLDLPPGACVLLDDFVDYTRGRPITYFQDGEPWRHTDFSAPYSETLRQAVLRAARAMDVPIVPHGTYLCCDGPRFETPAEVRMFASWGADVVGMTGLPEAVFAREAGMEYAALAIITNFGSGLTAAPVEHAAVTAAMAASVGRVRELLMAAAGDIVQGYNEGCNA